MARPATTADLRPQDFAGEEVIRVRTTVMPASGSLLYAMGQFIIAAEKAHLVGQTEYGYQTWSTPATDVELQERLEKMQARWDRAKDQYETIQLTGVKPDSNEYDLLERVRWYSVREGFNLPWDEK